MFFIVLNPKLDHSGNDLGTDLLLTAPHPFGLSCFKDGYINSIFSGGKTSLPHVLSFDQGFLSIEVK